MKTVVNRAPISLSVRFDGQDVELPPGESQIPSISVGYAKNQNPIMGSSDPNNPSMSGTKYLIGVKGVDECTPLTKAEWEDHLGRPCRLDWEALMYDRVGPKERVVFKGKGRKTQAQSSFDQGVRVHAPESLSEAS
jgi:hypothetical protein